MVPVVASLSSDGLKTTTRSAIALLAINRTVKSKSNFFIIVVIDRVNKVYKKYYIAMRKFKVNG